MYLIYANRLCKPLIQFSEAFLINSNKYIEEKKRKINKHDRLKMLMHLILQVFIVGCGSATFLVQYEIDCGQAEGREKQFLGDMATAKARVTVPC